MRLSLGAKSMGFLALMLGVVALGVGIVAAQLFVRESAKLDHGVTTEAARSAATETRFFLEGVAHALSLAAAACPADCAQLDSVFADDPDLLAVARFEQAPGERPVSPSHHVSPDLARLGDAQGDRIWKTLWAIPGFPFSELSPEGPLVVPFRLRDSTPAIAVAISVSPLAKEGRLRAWVGVVLATKLARTFYDDALVSRFLVDKHGRLIFGPSSQRVLKDAWEEHPLVQQWAQGAGVGEEKHYSGVDGGDARSGVSRAVGTGGLAVIAEIPDSRVWTWNRHLAYRGSLLAALLLFVALIPALFHFRAITRWLETFSETADRVAYGDFKVSVPEAKEDDIGALGASFNAMARGLDERERAREVVKKFPTREAADRLLSGEVRLQGERRDVTVLVVNVRGFTSMSEAQPPDQVLLILNEFFQRFVRIVHEHGGIVDKIVGDAAVAVWGLPTSRPDDTHRALRTCLAMRTELVRMNEARRVHGFGSLRVGMGMNRGVAIAGAIGFGDRTEYTVIGGAVSLAFRIETLSKDYSTDLLVTNTVFEGAHQHFLFEPLPLVFLSGLSGSFQLYSVVGFVDSSGKPVRVDATGSIPRRKKSA